MEAGISFANSGPFARPELFGQLARMAEECGFDSLWTVEHVVIPQPHMPYPGSKDGQMPGGDSVAIPDPLIPLAYAAAITTKIKLATGIVILPQRHPLYLAKQLATIDQLSHGRMLLGIGSGWMKEEFEAVGVDYHARGALTDESIQALRALWTENPTTFHGKHFHFHDVKSLPKPVQAGGIPIHIGGHSPAAARRAGRFGDGFFPTIVNPDKLKEIFGTMRDAAKEAGRNPDAIELTSMAAAKVDAVKAAQDAGVTRVVFGPPSSNPAKLRAGLERLANDVLAKV
jgi:probable F420-dependent oxidoreductase